MLKWKNHGCTMLLPRKWYKYRHNYALHLDKNVFIGVGNLVSSNVKENLD